MRLIISIFILTVLISLNSAENDATSRLANVIRKTFKGIDTDQDGNVTWPEYQAYLTRRFGPKLAMVDGPMIFGHADENGDRRINENEYIHYITATLGRADIVEKLSESEAALLNDSKHPTSE
ncbi:unnamed protein product, partial [Mesorhabditis spiculigera]